MARDIDYAATAVKTAIVEKFGRHNDLAELAVTAKERTISVQHAGREAEGTRDDLLAAVRRAATRSGKSCPSPGGLPDKHGIWGRLVSAWGVSDFFGCDRSLFT